MHGKKLNFSLCAQYPERGIKEVVISFWLYGHDVHVANLTVIAISIIYRKYCRMDGYYLVSKAVGVYDVCIFDLLWLQLCATVPLSYVTTPLGLLAEVLCLSSHRQLQFQNSIRSEHSESASKNHSQPWIDDGLGLTDTIIKAA